jgi:hypothetical protein
MVTASDGDGRTRSDEEEQSDLSAGMLSAVMEDYTEEENPLVG